ncbi:MAG: glycosyltransferase [Elusimicrobiales bacterium]
MLITLRFFFRARRRPPGSSGAAPAAVSVIVPCKGAAVNFETCILSLLEQDYPGEAEYLFVVPSRSDPAFGRLAAVLAGKSTAKLLVSGAEPSECSEKILNLLHGVRNVSERSQILLFADCDITVPPGWLTAMARPLEDPSVIAATAHAVPAPPPDNFPGQVMKAWVCAGIVYLDLMRIISGNSMAISRRDFALLGVERAWKTSLSEDLTLTALAKRSGRKIYFAAGAAPRSPGRPDLGEVFTVLNRWMVYFRFYAKAVWFQGALLTVFKFYSVWWALSRADLIPLAALASADAANVALISRAFKPYSGGRGDYEKLSGAALLRAAVRCSLLAAALQPVYAVNFLVSMFRREVTWAGRRYRIDAADRIKVIAAV